MDMEFYSTVLVANGTVSIIFALMASFGSILIMIAVVKNPLNVTRKPIHRIEDVCHALYLVAGAVLLPYFGVTEILRGVNNEFGPLDFPSFTSLLTDFLIASKLAMYLLINIERYAAYAHPHFHRVKLTKRVTFSVSLLFVAFCLLCSCISFTGIDERIYYIVFIHLFCSFSWFAFIVVSWLTYRKLKNRSRVAPDESNRLPQLREKAEFERARNALGARKYLQKLAKIYLPLLLSGLPWYIVKCIGTVCDVCLANKAGFFWQRFGISLVFVTDAYYSVSMIFHGEYSSTVKYIFCES